MAARPLPPTGSKPTSKETIATKSLSTVTQSTSSRPAIQHYLYAAFKKRWLRLAGSAVALFLLMIFVLPLFISVNRFRPRIELEATNALRRQVKLGDLSLSILSGSVTVNDIDVAEDPAFGKSSFITSKSLKVGVELMPLIFSKQLNVTGIVLNEPEITLLKTINGKWNFSSLGETSASKAPESQKSATATPGNFSIGKLEINNGKLIVETASSKTKPQVYGKVNVEVTNFSFTSQFPFKASAELPGGGNANVSGKAGPINPQDAAKTPLESSLKVRNVDLANSGFIDAASGIGGLANFDATLNSNGAEAKSVGQISCDKLKLSPRGSPAPRTVTIKYAANVELEKQAGTISQGDIQIGKALAQLTGGFQTQGQTQIVNLRLHAPGMPVNELEAMLPALGVALPSGSKLQGGTLSAELSVTGPIDKLLITGPVRLANTQLTGFDLGSRLGALSAFAGKAASSRDTSIENASLNAQVAPEGTRADDINLTVPAVGVITGSGTVSPNGALDFKMMANLHGGMAGGLTKVAGVGKGGIPFSIKGTTSQPSFVPDMAGVAEGIAEGALGNTVGKTGAAKGATAAGALGGLLGKKKPK